MRCLLAAALLVMLGAAAASAQNAKVIEARQKLYDEIGKAVKQPTKAFKGDDKFDLAKAQAALEAIEKNTALLPALFPEDSKTGKTEALPKIWDNKPDFESRLKKLNEAAKSAQTSITDEPTFMAQWKDFMGNCSGCHKEYRKPKE
jgi:cytochrome c556